MKIHISNGNSKLGRSIPNISLIPIKDCGNCAACKDDCYALKAWRLWPATRKAWKANSQAFRADPYEAAREVDIELNHRRKPPKFFRIHVAGDFLNQEHLDAWTWLALRWPAIKFLAFSKMHDLDYTQCPPNLQIVLSMWPGLPAPHNAHNAELPRAWVAPDPRIPENALECPGNCESCGFCWNLASINRDIFFEKH